MDEYLNAVFHIRFTAFNYFRDTHEVLNENYKNLAVLGTLGNSDTVIERLFTERQQSE